MIVGYMLWEMGNVFSFKQHCEGRKKTQPMTYKKKPLPNLKIMNTNK